MKPRTLLLTSVLLCLAGCTEGQKPTPLKRGEGAKPVLKSAEPKPADKVPDDVVPPKKEGDEGGTKL